MKRKHSHGPQSVHNKRDGVITARLNPIDPAIKPLCEVNYTIPKAWLDDFKLKESDKKEPLVNEHEDTLETQQTMAFPTQQAELKKELQQYIDGQLNNCCNTTESVSSESAGLQTIIDDLRDELSETRKQLDAVTLERNTYKSKTELTECKLWDEQDSLHEQIADLTATNQELTEKVKHLTAQNENLNKLINYDQDTTTSNTSNTSENTPENSQSTYIVFNRTLLTDFLKTTDLTSVIAHMSIPEDRTFAYIYDRITSQLQERNRNVASFQDYYIIEIPN